MKKLKLLLIVISCMVAFLTIHLIWTVTDGLTDENKSAQIGVVLGNKVNEDGTPSARLQARLDKALELYENGLVEKVIVSGGIGKEGYDEAAVMSDYLEQEGMKAEDIIEDNNGYNTRITAENAAQIIKEENLKIDQVFVISQFYHISRTKLAFKQEGFETVFGAHADYWEWRDIYSTIREIPAYYKYLLQR
ncbi:protein SanA, affects membrane permeability for vancomycin [Gracilibacillus ureilyticus]|uniref:Protein SanA, affects membrane permeability for vancomycin n=1 Tax=Gracilibacillus ureilyticus TaxID=531814 RepID=A0A1H9P5Y3_9BACI|nr:YdcF family protein [Gracilibacillus ureilyticus]SER43497.1 protein SanA, affects membrane permeability for vancomycin [Gracilibacillus ureilyticus]